MSNHHIPGVSRVGTLSLETWIYLIVLLNREETIVQWEKIYVNSIS